MKMTEQEEKRVNESCAWLERHGFRKAEQELGAAEGAAASGGFHGLSHTIEYKTVLHGVELVCGYRDGRYMHLPKTWDCQCRRYDLCGRCGFRTAEEAVEEAVKDIRREQRYEKERIEERHRLELEEFDDMAEEFDELFYGISNEKYEKEMEDEERLEAQVDEYIEDAYDLTK